MYILSRTEFAFFVGSTFILREILPLSQFIRPTRMLSLNCYFDHYNLNLNYITKEHKSMGGHHLDSTYLNGIDPSLNGGCSRIKQNHHHPSSSSSLYNAARGRRMTNTRT
jgi:hypothetical protein